MRRLCSSAISFAITGLVIGAASGAAAEQLVMPHSCGFEGNRLIVRPAANRTYEIVGPRDQQAFTTCQSGGQSCTTLMVHRFAIKCEGVQVPWMRVAAIIPPRKGGRQWIEGGRLHIVRPVQSSMERTGACANGRQRSFQNRDCFPWTPSPLLERIQLPAGYAPLGNARARISTGPVADASPPTGEPAGPPAPAATGESETQMPASVQVRAGPPTGNMAAVTPAQPATALQPSKGPVMGSAKGSDWVAVVEAKDLSEVTHTAAPARHQMLWAWLGGLGLLGLLALVLTRVPAERRVAIAGEVRQRADVIWCSLVQHMASLRSQQSAPEPEQTAATDDPALASAAWAAATLLDQIEQAVGGLEASTPLRDVLEEELASIQQRLVVTRASSLDGGAPAKAAAQFRALIRELERVKRIANSAAASLSGARPALSIPQTKSEAYQLLGVNADASEGILKKLVDALRMTWHPDHARDEQDRLLREDRIKQINIAWELISDKRQAA